MLAIPVTSAALSTAVEILFIELSLWAPARRDRSNRREDDVQGAWLGE